MSEVTIISSEETNETSEEIEAIEETVKDVQENVETLEETVEDVQENVETLEETVEDVQDISQQTLSAIRDLTNEIRQWRLETNQSNLNLLPPPETIPDTTGIQLIELPTVSPLTSSETMTQETKQNKSRRRILNI